MTQPLELTTDLVLTAHSHREDPKFAEVRSQYETITKTMILFQTEVWGKWLQRTVESSRTCAFESQSEDVQLLAFTTAGRIMVTLYRLANRSRHVTMIGACEGDQQIGLQGIRMTAEQAVALLQDACRLTQALWNNFRDSDTVTLAGF